MYQINEIFETLQGEATYTGTPSIFVRLQGCPVGCPWCDTQHTWTIDPEKLVTIDGIIGKPEESDCYAEQSADELLALFKKLNYKAKHVVITGGEPAMFDLMPMCELLHQAGYSTQIETSGTFELKVPADTWVTVSPKIDMKGGYEVLASAMQRADEIKHPIAMEKHVEELQALLAEHKVAHKRIYLQPISQQLRATELAISTCIENNWRLSVQLHKYLGIE